MCLCSDHVEKKIRDIQSINSISNRFMCKAGWHCCSAEIMNICECVYGMWILISVSHSVSVILQYHILGKIVLAVAFSACAHVIYNICQISNGKAKSIWHFISIIRAGMAKPCRNSSIAMAPIAISFSHCHAPFLPKLKRNCHPAYNCNL